MNTAAQQIRTTKNKAPPQGDQEVIDANGRQNKRRDPSVSSSGRQLLTNAGKVSHKQAIDKATKEYRKYQVKTLSPVEEEYLKVVQDINKTAKKKSRER